MMIPEELYGQVVRCMPIPCVDVIVRNAQRIVLVRRRHEPLANEWWVPGGRIHRGEQALDAARRKVREDIGLEMSQLRFVGYYEDEFERGPLGSEAYHSISLVFEGIAASDTVVLGIENSDWKLAHELPERFSRRIHGSSTSSSDAYVARP